MPPHDDRPHPSRTLLILGLAAVAFSLAQTTLIPAIPELQRSLHANASSVAATMAASLTNVRMCGLTGFTRSLGMSLNEL